MAHAKLIRRSKGYQACSANFELPNSELKEENECLRHNYLDAPFDPKYLNAELVDKVINEFRRSKAPGLNTLTAKRLQYSDPAIATVLIKLFYLIITRGHIPPRFGISYTFPC